MTVTPAVGSTSSVAVPDNVWPLAQYQVCLGSGVEDAYRGVLPAGLVAAQDYVLPASVSVPRGTASVGIRSSGAASNSVWLAPPGTTSFVEGPTMTRAGGIATSIGVPASTGTYKLYVVDAGGGRSLESAAQLRVR